MAYPTTDPLPCPTLRQEYTDKKNPLFASDIVVLNKQLFTMCRMLLGLPTSGATAFAIISGMEYTAGGGGSYAPGWVYMNGNFYYSAVTLEGKYLKPDIRDSALKTFPDTSIDYLYSDYYCITSDVAVDSMPQFTGSMNQYRRNLTNAVVGMTGEIRIWSTITAPLGWILCDGTAISRTTYSALFNVIGTTFGVGDTTTTFNLPDLGGQFIAGYKSSDSDYNAIAKTGGEKTHTLSEAELPAHTHTVAIHEGTDALAGGSEPAMYAGSSTNTSSVGSGTAHENRPPFVTFSYIIKY
jgi:microcystin-dependent protein